MLTVPSPLSLSRCAITLYPLSFDPTLHVDVLLQYRRIPLPEGNIHVGSANIEATRNSSIVIHVIYTFDEATGLKKRLARFLGEKRAKVFLE